MAQRTQINADDMDIADGSEDTDNADDMDIADGADDADNTDMDDAE